MRIAFVGHSYHLTTGSSDFLLELLRRCGEVQTFYDESWLTGAHSGWAADFRSDDFDCIVVFQAPEPFARLDTRHPNIVFVPMLDGHLADGRFWWREQFSEVKVLCLSATLENEIAAFTPMRFFAQFSPPVAGLPALAEPDRLNAFFWYRRPPLDPELLRRLTGRTVFDRFTLQRAPDPGTPPAAARGPRPLARTFVDVEPWLADRAGYLERLAEHTVYFAPRLYEGIGMGFLEAMALGLCVVAPDTPTHNEYISHGATGLLYSPARPVPLAFDDFRQLSRRARESAERRRELWESHEGDLLDFLCTPRERLERPRTLVDFWRQSTAPGPAGALPTLTVVTAHGDPAADLVATLASVAEQDYPGLKHVVLGDDSDAGTDRPGVRFLARRSAAASGGEYTALADALTEVESEYVLFLPAGDQMVSPQALQELLRWAPRDADVVYGHFVSRDARGIDHLCLVAEVGRVLGQLDASGFDAHWMERAPCLQATAFRTSRLRRFGFDPALRFAADFDLHCRLSRAGARYHLCDGVIALCRPEGGWARLLALCAGEWLRLAVRHGRSRGARRLFVGLGVEAVEAWESTLWGWLDRARRRHRRRFAPASSDLAGDSARRPSVRERALAAGLRAAARHLAAAERFFAARWPVRRAGSVHLAGEPDETYFASFADGIDFRRRGRPSFVAKLAGISWPEPWGRWTDGPRVEIVFRRILPRRACVVLEAFAFETIARAPVEVTIGAAVTRLALDGEPFRTYRVDLETSGREQTLALTLPLPPAPARSASAGEGERRRLGLALRTLHILDLEDPAGTAG